MPVRDLTFARWIVMAYAGPESYQVQLGESPKVTLTIHQFDADVQGYGADVDSALLDLAAKVWDLATFEPKVPYPPLQRTASERYHKFHNKLTEILGPPVT